MVLFLIKVFIVWVNLEFIIRIPLELKLFCFL